MTLAFELRDLRGESDASQMTTKRRLLSVTESAKAQRKGLSDCKMPYNIDNVTVARCATLHSIRTDRSKNLALAAGPRVRVGHPILRRETDHLK